MPSLKRKIMREYTRVTYNNAEILYMKLAQRQAVPFCAYTITLLCYTKFQVLQMLLVNPYILSTTVLSDIQCIHSIPRLCVCHHGEDSCVNEAAAAESAAGGLTGLRGRRASLWRT